VKRWLAFLLALLNGLRRRRRRRHEVEEARRERIVPPGSPQRGWETAAIVLFFAAALCALGFIVIYGLDSLGNRTQLFGLTLGGSLGLVAAALIIVGRRLVVTEEKEEEFPELEHPQEQEAIAQVVDESASRLTRKRLLLGAGGAAGGALGLAALAPALSLGPLLNTDPLYETPWRRGVRLIGEDGLPLRADAVEEGSFYTAFPAHAKRDDIAAPVVVVRLDPAKLQLPPERARWAPGGILAFSKVCTHAGCAIALYRKPTFTPTQPRPALVCPCHYSTFDPATGGEVISGPAGRPLPQLPLIVGGDGVLRAGGDYSGPVGPSWSGVRSRGPDR
jgi:ubiquinol-cytochrome c reductase iron-sulfur subunit